MSEISRCPTLSKWLPTIARRTPFRSEGVDLLSVILFKTALNTLQTSLVSDTESLVSNFGFSELFSRFSSPSFT